jgi:hypothetical protein
MSVLGGKRTFDYRANRGRASEQAGGNECDTSCVGRRERPDRVVEAD